MGIRIVIADEHLIFSEALSKCFESVPGFEVVGAVGERSGVIPAASTGGAAVLVASEALIGQPWGLADEMRRRVPSCGIALIASRPNKALASRALEAGVLSVVPKEASLPQLIKAIRGVAAGARTISPDLLGPPEHVSMARTLNDRELEILRSTVTGASLKEISRELYLAPGTVRNLASSAIRKLTARNRFDAARIAREHGWI
ncbi:response regulator transcription factor [Streptomyces sp. XM4193]|uniref:Response regulator transcription factor n=1 Tax=Streptomyces tardus TaxID=2780544 RepID=A0A949JJ38_9ACTN|nr:MULTISPECIES: response regulator transcription factor [Streptomyces]MBU7597174.1 response regulator transcription factor [Streptomyces tardus]MCK1795167.1 response regulator transcription factor [Streptomyces sp. XM4193]